MFIKSVTRLVSAVLLLASGGMALALDDAVSLTSPKQILGEGLDNFYPTMTVKATLTTFRHSRRIGEKKVLIEARREGESFAARGEFLSPPLERGTVFLVIGGNPEDDSQKIGNEYFVYLPALRKMKRVSGRGKSDRFFGSALEQSDMEIHPSWHFEILGARKGEFDGEGALIISARPIYDSGYASVEYVIALSDRVILAFRGFSTNGSLLRTITTRRAWLVDVDGHLLPERVEVEEPGRGLRTVIEYSERKILKPTEFPRNRFSASGLALGK